jgi:hypothetical protein
VINYYQIKEIINDTYDFRIWDEVYANYRNKIHNSNYTSTILKIRNAILKPTPINFRIVTCSTVLQTINDYNYVPTPKMVDLIEESVYEVMKDI